MFILPDEKTAKIPRFAKLPIKKLRLNLLRVPAIFECEAHSLAILVFAVAGVKCKIQNMKSIPVLWFGVA